jgi:hypothetical protein
LLLVVGVSCLAASGRARAATSSTLTSSEFTFTLSRLDASGNATALDSNGLMTFFSAARCACPTSVVATLTLSTDGLTALGTSALDAQIMVGSDCDNAAATGCRAVGAALTLGANKASSQDTLSTSDIFGATSCAAGATSTRVWAIVRVDGVRQDSQPSLAINLGGAGPTAPSAVKAQTADSGLAVSWTDPSDASTIQGHQVLCSPGVASPPAAAFETCAALPTGGGDGGVFATLDPTLVCSGLVTVGTNSVRVGGLENGQTYQIAVVAIGNDGTPSAPSPVVTASPGPTKGFDDIYFENGGSAQTGCAVAPRGRGGARAWALIAALAVLTAGWRRRRARRPRRRGAALVVALLAGLTGQARAELLPPPEGDLAVAPPPVASSPRTWNVELRFAPYRPDVDSEFAARGSDARPYQQVFSSGRHLLTALEIDRQLSHRFGTWALGVGAGYTRATAASLSADLSTRTGDQTSLLVVPLSLSLVYRADQLRRYEGFGLIPYAKLGVDCALWRISDTAKADSIDGKTLGWHAAAGVSLDLSFIDPESARTMDIETGVNQAALLFEVARYALDGFGSSSVLHVGDTTWIAGLMLEL